MPTIKTRIIAILLLVQGLLAVPFLIKLAQDPTPKHILLLLIFWVYATLIALIVPFYLWKVKRWAWIVAVIERVWNLFQLFNPAIVGIAFADPITFMGLIITIVTFVLLIADKRTFYP